MSRYNLIISDIKTVSRLFKKQVSILLPIYFLNNLNTAVIFEIIRLSKQQFFVVKPLLLQIQRHSQQHSICKGGAYATSIVRVVTLKSLVYV